MKLLPFRLCSRGEKPPALRAGAPFLGAVLLRNGFGSPRAKRVRLVVLTSSQTAPTLRAQWGCVKSLQGAPARRSVGFHL